MRTPNPGRFCFILGVSALAFGIAGCSDDDSSSGPIGPDRMYPDFTALADGKGGTKLRARVTIGGYRTSTAFVELKDGVNATVGTEQKPLPLLPDNTTGQHGADFAEPDGERKLSITHNIVEPSAEALVSTATLPAPFTLEMASTGVIPRDQPIDFTWSPIEAEGRMDYALSGKCIDATPATASKKNIGSIGKFTIPKAKYTQITTTNKKDDGTECQVTLTVDRVLYGTVDSKYKWGDFIATQRRVITFTSGAPVAAPAAP